MTVGRLVKVVMVWRRATGAARELVQGHKAKQATAQHVSSIAFCRNATSRLQYLTVWRSAGSGHTPFLACHLLV